MKSKIILLFFLASFTCIGQKQFELFFDFNKDFPNEQSVLNFNEWISTTKAIEITQMLGYCDSVDSKEYNKQLAERRIAAVQKLLEKSGIPIHSDVPKIAFGKEFKQAKIQADNRKVTLFYHEKNPPEEIGLTKKILNAQIGESVKLANVYFFNNSARMLPKSEPVLLELLCVLEENPTLKIEIQGHICCQEQFDYNNVSVSRARAVYLFLLRNKIAKKRLSFKGFGSSKPIHPIPEKSVQEQEDNRRVEIMILEK